MSRWQFSYSVPMIRWSYKLQNYGVRGVVNQWFKSYLSGRKQITSIRDSYSDIGSVTVGVPQGSVLGPVLFLLYINDICNAIPDAKIKLFADDSNLFLYDTSLSNLYHRANLSLTCLSKWFLVNRLSLSVDKTCYSIFGNQHNDSFTPNLQVEINGKAIQKIECCKYLGIYINNNLSW